MFLHQLLRNRALLTERDVDIHLIPPLLLADAYRAKVIDADVNANTLTVARFESLGLAKMVVTLNDILPRLQYGVIIYGPNLLVRNPGLGQRFMNGYPRGVRQYLEGKTDRNVAIIKKHTNDDEALLRKIPWPLIHADGHVNVESILQQQAWMVRGGWLERVVSPEQFLDSTYAQRAFRIVSANR